MRTSETGGSAAPSHTARLRVRYQNTDAMGVVYYANYLAYFEVGRVELLRALGADYARLEREGFAAAVVEARCRYHIPAVFDDLLEVETRLVHVGRTSFRFEYEIRRAESGQVLATGHTEHALLVKATLRPARLPEWARIALTSRGAGGPGSRGAGA